MYRWLISAALVGVVFLQGCNDNKEASQDIHHASIPSHYEHLKALEWLVGDWQDDSDDIDITYSTKWDKNKNFIYQHFILKHEGEDDLEGQQIIGWDPIEQRIHSWVFDSDGGYGESYWSQQGNSWYSTMAFTFADGEKGSVTNVYTKVDDNSYTYSAESRDVNGDLLPDIGPFKVVRIKKVVP